MKKALYLIFSLSLTLLFACEKQVLNLNKSLIGQWEFKRAEGGFTGKQVILPEEGVKTVLSFDSDQQFRKLVNGQVEEQGAYDVVKVRSIFTGKDADAIKFPESSPQIVSLKGDSLMLTDNRTEPFAYLYLRVK